MEANKVLKFFFAALLVPSLCAAQTRSASKPKPKQQAAPKYELKQYFLVFLKTGPNRNQDSATGAKIQQAHLLHMRSMVETGKMDMAGPLGDDGDIRGICIYNVPTAAEAKACAEADPAVKAGRLIVEVHPFWTHKGAKLR